MRTPLTARSWLFVPGDSERKQVKAFESAADAVILDLEDSVCAQKLPEARHRVTEALRAHPERGKQQLWVRVNSPSSGRCIEDLNAVMPGGPSGIVLPKISATSEILEVSRYLTDLESQEGRGYCEVRLLVIATETPQAVLSLSGWPQLLHADQRLGGLTWGMEDLSAAIGAHDKYQQDGRLTLTFELARTLCLLTAASLNVQAIDGVHANFRDAAGLTQELVRARRDGFTGKLAIHPDQIGPINAALTPTEEEIQEAQRIVAAFNASGDVGVTSLDGRMLDRPHLLLAQRILERAGRR